MTLKIIIKNKIFKNNGMPSKCVWDNSNDERDVESIIALVNILTSNRSK